MLPFLLLAVVAVAVVALSSGDGPRTLVTGKRYLFTVAISPKSMTDLPGFEEGFASALKGAGATDFEVDERSDPDRTIVTYKMVAQRTGPVEQPFAFAGVKIEILQVTEL